MIVVTGATGRLGSQIVDRLLERVPATGLAVSVRDAGKAAHLAGRGVRVREGDFTDPATLAHAFEGASQVLVISAAIHGPAALHANIAAIDAARAAGAGRVLYTSHQAASPDSLFAPQTTHAGTEEYLLKQGGDFTALRNGFYAGTLEWMVGDALRTGTVAAPADGPVSWTEHADLAEIAAVALTRPGALDGITPPLTAPAQVDLADVAGILGDITGRRIGRAVVGDDEWAAAAAGRGMPATAVDFTLGMYRAARRGEFAVTDPTLEAVLARPATPVRATLERIAAAAR